MKTKKEKLFHDILETIGVAMVFSIPSSIGPTMPPVENINLLRQSLQEARGVVEPIVLGKKEGKKGIQGFCSGTKIRDQILTVRHCIDGTELSKINFTNLTTFQSQDAAILISIDDLDSNNVTIGHRLNYKEGLNNKSTTFVSKEFKLDIERPFCKMDKINWNKVYLNGLRTNSKTNKQKKLSEHILHGNSGAGVFYANPNNKPCLVGPIVGGDLQIIDSLISLNKVVSPAVYINDGNEFYKEIIHDQKYQGKFDGTFKNP